MYAAYDISTWITTCDANKIPIEYSAANQKMYRKAGHPIDTNAHGTYVTGLIAGKVDNEASTNGTVSPAFNFRVLPISANEPFSDRFWTLDLVNSVNYAVAQRVKVINISIQGDAYDESFQQAIYRANNAGITVVAASGNDGTNTPLYPASFNHVISVGAVNPNKTKSGYSQYGSSLDLVAYVGETLGAGTSVFQKTLTCDMTMNCRYGDYFSTMNEVYSNGTSFASPQIAAAAAIIYGNNPSIRPPEVLRALIQSADDIGVVGRDDLTGHGVINFQKANQFRATTSSTKKLYLPSYKTTTDGTYKESLTLGNPSTTQTVYASFDLYDSTMSFHRGDALQIAPDSQITVDLAQYHEGNALELTSSEPVYASIRSEVNKGPDETLLLTPRDFATKFYYPAFRYDPPTYRAWITIGNPSTNTKSTTIEIKHGGNYVQTLTVKPGEAQVTNLGATVRTGGPVEVTSINGVPFYTTIKSEVNGIPDETAGIPETKLTTEYYLTAFRWELLKLKGWIIIGNPSTTDVPCVSVEHYGTAPYVKLIDNQCIDPGKRIQTGNFGTSILSGGPVKIYSTNGLPFYVSLKSEVSGGPDETVGLRLADMDTKFYYPRMVWTSEHKAWLIVANASTTETAQVTIYHKGMNKILADNISIEPGKRFSTGNYDADNLIGGPVIVTSNNGVKIYTTLKSEMNDFPDETEGISQSSIEH